MSITAEDIVRLFEEDARARRRLAELLVSEPDVRLAIINAVLRDVATKQDLERLREELRREFQLELGRLEERLARLEERVGRLEERVARVEGQLGLLVKLFVAFNVPVLVGIIAILLRLALPH